LNAENVEKFTVEIDEDLEEIVPIFLDNRNKEIILLKQHLADKAINEIQTIGHKLAGNAGSYGFDALGEVGAKLEDASKSENWETIETCINQIENYMAGVEVKFI
jgi:HPt (histidine-containing phosphotransfer) domain-containing protein